MQRAAVLWRASPARVVLALFALMLAAAMAVGSGANFNSTSANPGNMVTAGVLSHSNSKAGTALLNVTKMKPGDSQNGTVTISNTGDIDGVFTVAAANVVSTPGANGGNLANILDLKVDDMGATGAGPAVTKYTGKLGAMTSAALGTWTASETHVYRFTVTWPNGTTAVDNLYKGSKVAVDFNWESQSS
jgi:spore coat-associated protein N